MTRFCDRLPLASVILACLIAISSTSHAQEGAMNQVQETNTASNLEDFDLIPREALFGNPNRTAGQLSPDGKWLGWIAPKDGVLNVWIAPSDDPLAARAMTSATDRPIRRYFFAPDSGSLLYIQDKDGDENFLLYQIDLETTAEKSLTLFENTRVLVIAGSFQHRDRILIGLNNRDPRYHDIWLLNLESGQLTEVFRNEAGYSGFEADDNLDLRLAFRQNASGGNDIFRMDQGQVEVEPFVSTTLEDSQTTGTLGYSYDGQTLYWRDSRGRDTAALVAEDTATGERTVLAEDARADIGGAMRDPATGVVQAYSVNYLRNEWTALDPALEASFDWLRSRLDGDFGVRSRSDDDRIWIVGNDPLTAPPRTFIYNRDAATLEDFYTIRPELEGAPLQPMHPLELTSRDGLTLVSYLTLPPGSDSNADGIPDAPVPMVLLVHGGPWGRDSYGYNNTHQWLANRGYAVLSVNFRASTGFGKSFISAGDLEWGAKMHDDLIDATDWAIAKHIARPDKIAIMGGSYGGYATLVGLTFTPEKFACGVDIVGPSNLETLISTIPPYWEPRVRQFHERMGNPNTPEGQALLRERSPLYRAGNIVRPLLIGQGANDPRVKQDESDQIVGAMNRAGIPVTYVLYPDEGHGFSKPANMVSFMAAAENFLSDCIGGRAEPIGGAIEASSAQVLEGAEYVPGLSVPSGG